MQSISVGRPAAGSVHLIDDNSTLKQAGLDSDCHIDIGWADGLWIRNMLPGLNHGRNFLLRVPGLDSGKARIGNIRILVAQKLRILDVRMIRLFMNDRELLNDRHTAEKEGLHWPETHTASNDHQLECRFVLEEFFDEYERRAAFKSGLRGDAELCEELTLESLKVLERLAEDEQSPAHADIWKELGLSLAERRTFKPITLERRLCIVCSEEKYWFEFPERITQRCGHAPTICTDDLMIWVAAELQSKAWNRIRCPECTNTLCHGDMKKHASLESFKRLVPQLPFLGNLRRPFPVDIEKKNR